MRFLCSKDDVWKSLCFSKWGTENARDILGVMLADSTAFSSAMQCFHLIEEPACPPVNYEQLSTTTTNQTTINGAVHRELHYHPEDYIMVVTVSQTKPAPGPQPVFGMAIRGQEIPEFFESGKMNYNTLRHFHGFKKIENEFNDDGELVAEYSDWIRDLDFDVKVTMIRIPDQRPIHLVTWSMQILNLSSTGSGENGLSFDSPSFGWDDDDLLPLVNHDYGRALF